MNALTLATLPVLAGALLTTQTPAPIEPVEKDAPAPVVVEAPRPVRAASPFARRTLQTGGLQPATRLHSAAVGLTPEADWRAKFPAKGHAR